jgi:hypothetical protein
MPGGLEAIAMAALQELQQGSSSTNNCFSAVNYSSTGGAVSVPFSPTTKMTTTTAGIVQDDDDNDDNGDDDNDDNNHQGSRPGPSSPAVVSSTSQEEHDNNKQLQEQDPSSSHASRVVSFESMDPRYHSSFSIALQEQQQQQQDVADQVLAVLEAAKDSKEAMEPTLNHNVQKNSSIGNNISLSKKAPVMKKLLPPAKKVTEEKNPSSYTAAAAIAAQTRIQGEAETESFISKILLDPENFLLSMEPHFSSCLNKTIDTKVVIRDGVRPNDVLCGRGGETNHHTYVTTKIKNIVHCACWIFVEILCNRLVLTFLSPLSLYLYFYHRGNIQYRKLVKAYRGLYVQSTRRIKPKVAQCIVYSIRQMGGRFLKRVENGNNNTGGKDSEESSSTNSSNNNNNAWWVDVGNIKAREKTSQALREGAPDLRSVNTATGTTAVPQQESPRSTSVMSSDAVSAASGGLESTCPSFVVPGSSAALAGFSSAMPSHVPSSSGNRYPATTMGYEQQLPISASHSLTNHPLFHTLSPYQKHQILMEEVQAAREAAAAAAEFASLRNYHNYQRGMQDPFGHGGHNNLLPGQGHVPQAGYDKLGSAAVGNGVSPSLPDQMQLRMNSNQQQHSWNGVDVGRNGHLNQRKRTVPVAVPSLPESLGNTDMNDDNANTTCRGPRLKRLKQRRQLEA